MRRHDPRDNPGVVLAALTFGVLVSLVQPVTAPAPGTTTPPPAVVPVAAPAPAALPVQRVVRIAAQPAVLSTAGVVRGAPSVVLTFDDGPDPAWTPQVLELLRRNGAVATFCVVGNQARKHPELVRAIVDAGMRLCNHSRSHPAGLGQAPEQVQVDQILGARDELAQLTDAPVAYFRSPGGSWSPSVLTLAAEHGMQPLGWSVDLRDWQRPGTLPILDTLERQLRPGAVILMHDGGGADRSETVDALRLMLPWLRESGYRFAFPTP